MKHTLKVSLAALLVVGIAGYSFAKEHKKSEKFDRVVAQVVTLDAAADTMVVKEEKTGETKTIKISAKAASQIKVGDRVRIKLKPGTDESLGVRVLKGEPKVETPSEPVAVPETK